MRILITGGSGFIGTNLIDAALREDHDVLSIDKKEPKKPAHASVFERVDLTDLVSLQTAVQKFKPTHVWHMGARTDLAEGVVDEVYSANTIGTRNLIAALKSVDSVERCIHASTKLVCASGKTPPECGDLCPDTVYGESKASMERIIRADTDTPWQWCIVRPSSIWGPWFGVPYLGFFLSVARGRYMHLGNVNPPRSFGYVGNIVYQIEKLTQANADAIHGKVFYVTDYEEYRIREWAEQINDSLGRRPVRAMPEPLVQSAAKVGDLLKVCGWKNPPLTSFRLNNMRTDTSHIPIDELREITGPLPHSLADGIEATTDWMKQQRMI